MTTVVEEEKKQWTFSQVFGESRNTLDDVQDVDVVSAIEFDDSGDFIAVGDKGGRIVLFEREVTQHTHQINFFCYFSKIQKKIFIFFNFFLILSLRLLSLPSHPCSLSASFRLWIFSLDWACK